MSGVLAAALAWARQKVGAARPTQVQATGVAAGNAAREVRFDYIDAGGRWSRRTVSIAAHGDEMFDAFCEDRQDLRTFRYDRIQGDIIDVDTGEVIEVRTWRQQATGW